MLYLSPLYFYFILFLVILLEKLYSALRDCVCPFLKCLCDHIGVKQSISGRLNKETLSVKQPYCMKHLE